MFIPIICLLLGACNLGPSPRQILNQAHDTMREVQSYRWAGEIETKTADGVIGGRQSGEWAGPGRWHMKMEPSGGLAGQTSEEMVVDGRLFMRELGSNGGEWREFTPLPEGFTAYNPRPESYLDIPDLKNLRRRDDVVVNETATFQITAERKETRTLGERIPPRPEGDEVEWITTYTWFISKEDYFLVRVVIEQDTALGQATHRNAFDFYDYNQPVIIEVPEIAG